MCIGKAAMLKVQLPKHVLTLFSLGDPKKLTESIDPVR
jgi:hypothetical protein